MKTAEERWAKHKEHALGKRDNGALYAALRKYGPNTFTLEVIITSDDWDNLCELEKQFIQSFNTLSPNGYNISSGGEGVQGKRSDADKKKISDAQRKRFQRPEERERMRRYSKLSKTSPKWIASCIARRKPKKALMSKADWYKRLMQSLSSAEVKSKTSEAAKKRWQDPITRPKLLSALEKIRKLRCST